MKKSVSGVVAIVLIIILNSCNVSRETNPKLKTISTRFVYLQPNEETKKIPLSTQYYNHGAIGREKEALALLNTRYFNNIGVNLVFDRSTMVSDTLFDIKESIYVKGALDKLWLKQYSKFKKTKVLTLVVKPFDYPIAGMGFDNVILITDKYLISHVVLHEFGHACGLSHRKVDVCNFMYPSTFGGINQDEITRDQMKQLKKAIRNRF